MSAARVPDRYHTVRRSGLPPQVEEDNPYHPDPRSAAAGLAAERTMLAWNRSGLAVFATAAVFGRRLWPFDSTWKLVAAAALAVGVSLWLVVLLFTTRTTRPEPGATGAGFRRLTVATVVFALGATALALLPPPPPY